MGGNLPHPSRENETQSLISDESFMTINTDLIPSHSTLTGSKADPHSPLLADNQPTSLFFLEQPPDDVQQTVFNIVYTRPYLFFFVLMFFAQLGLLIYTILIISKSNDDIHEPLWIIIADTILVALSALDLFARAYGTGFRRFYGSCFNITDTIITLLSVASLVVYLIKTSTLFLAIIFLLFRNLFRILRLILLFFKHRQTRRIVRATERDILDMNQDEYRILAQHSNPFYIDEPNHETREHVVIDDDELDNSHSHFSPHHQHQRQHLASSTAQLTFDNSQSSSISHTATISTSDLTSGQLSGMPPPMGFQLSYRSGHQFIPSQHQPHLHTTMQHTDHADLDDFSMPNSFDSHSYISGDSLQIPQQQQHPSQQQPQLHHSGIVSPNHSWRGDQTIQTSFDPRSTRLSFHQG